MKKILLALMAFAVVTACNNSSEEAKTDTDTTSKMDHDTSHNHGNMTGNIPDLPAIPEGAKVFFKNLKDGASVSSPVKVEMGVENIKIDTAGPVVAASGHFHIIIDAEDSIASGGVVAKDSTHIHYGKGQVEDNLKLTPGKHKLVIQFADGLHRSYGSKLAAVINVTIKK